MAKSSQEVQKQCDALEREVLAVRQAVSIEDENKEGGGGVGCGAGSGSRTRLNYMLSCAGLAQPWPSWLVLFLL